MTTIGDILNNMAVNMGRTTAADFNPSTLTPAGPNINLGHWALNSARRKVERLHDFHYSRANPLLSIGSAGALLTAAYESGGTAAITGTLSPNIVGSFALTGTYNGAPFFTFATGGVTYFLFFTGTAWQIRPGAFSGSNGWNRTTTSLDPSGSFTATGSSTGTATVAASTTAPSIKRVTSVDLPIAGGEYVPIEFLTADEWSDRVKRQVGRASYSASATLDSLGIGGNNPIAYQDGQRIYLTPASQFASFPVVARLGVIAFLPDYDADGDRDFFTDFAPEYLQWQAILELNKFWRRYIPKQEGNVDEGSVEAMAQEALQTLLQWDSDIAKGTSTPAGSDAPAPPK